MSASIIATTAVVLLQVSSPSFKNNDYIPAKFSCEGSNTSPAINVTNIPAKTVTLAIVVEDPDAPQGTVTHWVAWNIDPSGKISEKSKEGVQGKNTKGKNEYMGPCPPSGVHHYHFTVYALDAKIDLPAGSSKEELRASMQNHIIGQGELIGLYQKKSS